MNRWTEIMPGVYAPAALPAALPPPAPAPVSAPARPAWLPKRRPSPRRPLRRYHVVDAVRLPY